MNKSRRSSGRVYTRLVCLDCSLDRMARPARAPRPRGKKSTSREKSNMESITKVTADEPQPTEKLGYTALMIKEENFEGLAEDGHSKHLPVSQKLTLLEEPEVDIYSVVANEKNLGDGGPDSESQGTYEELLLRHVHHAGSIKNEGKEGDCTEEDGAIEMNLQLSDQVDYQTLKKEDVHVDDGCSKEDSGKGIHASQLGEVNYLTLTCYVKEEPLDSDSMEGVVNGANWGMIKPQPLGEEGVRPPLLPVISDSRVQQLDDNLSSQAEQGAPLDSSESDSSTSRCGPCNYANNSGKKQSVAERETLDQGLSHHVYGQMDTERTKECDKKCEETLIEGIGQSSQFGGTEENLAKPLFTLVAGEPYISQCPFCNKEFSNVLDVESHSCLMKPTREMIFKCSLCNKKFTQSTHLLRHATDARNHKGMKSLYQCSLCNQRFFYLSSLLKHVKLHSQRYPCLVCDLRFSSEKRLLMHSWSHRKDEPCECAVCKKTFPDAMSLAYHTRTHVGRNPYQHSACDLRFSDEKRPTRATRYERNRTGKNLFECHICNKIYLYERALTSHMETHTIKKLLCSGCGELFHDNFDLSLHMRSSHTGEKPYQCSVCSERFSKANSLLIHMKSHPAENPTNVWFVP